MTFYRYLKYQELLYGIDYSWKNAYKICVGNDSTQKSEEPLMNILHKIGLPQRTTLIVVRIIALLILLYAVADAILIVLWATGKEGGHINLGILLTIVIGIGMMFLRDWARKLEILLSLAAIVLGLVNIIVPPWILNGISFYYVTLQSVLFSGPKWLIILGMLILAVEVLFLILPATIGLFRAAERGELPRKVEEKEEV